MSANLITALWRPPFSTGAVNQSVLPAGATLRDLVDHMPNLPADFEAHGQIRINNNVIFRKFWPNLKPVELLDGKPLAITFHLPPQDGGGGGGGGKNQTAIALVAALTITLATAGASAGVFAGIGGSGLFAAGSLSAKVLAGAIAIGGSLAISALTGPPVASAGRSDNNTEALGAASATGNILAAFTTIPRVIGEHRIFPPGLAEPLIELIGDDEVVEAIYGLSGPHRLNDIRLGDGLIEEATDIQFETREGFLGETPIELVTRYGRTNEPNIELSAHDVEKEDQNDLADQVLPQNSVPKWHQVSSKNAPDEIWLHFLLPEGIFERASASTVYTMPLRLRIRKRGDTTWINLPEVHISSKQNGELRRAVLLKWQSAPESIPSVPANEGFISAYTDVPGQTATPADPGWQAHGHFIDGSGPDVLRNGNSGSTNVQNINLYFNRVEIFLDEVTFPKGFYDIEVKRGHAFKNSDFDIDDYEYNSTVRNFFGYYLSGSNPIIAVSREGLAERIFLRRVISVKNTHPLPAQGLAIIAIKATNRAIAGLSVLAAGYVPDWDDTGWRDYKVTSNPAPHYVHLLSEELNADPLPDDIRDDVSILAWRDRCETEGHECNYIIEGAGLEDTLRIVASCGWAKPRASEVWGVIQDYDRSAENVSQIFTPSNSDGFNLAIGYAQKIDGFRVTFKDKSDNYEERSIIVYQPGIQSGNLLEAIAYEGLVTEAEVRTRATFDLKQLTARANFPSLNVFWDALKSTRGDLVGVSHDILLETYGSGRVVQVFHDAEGRIEAIQLDNIVAVKNEPDMHEITDMHAIKDMHDVGARSGLALRRGNGNITTHELSNPTGNYDLLNFKTPINDADIGEDDLITVARLAQEYGRYIITGIERENDFQAAIAFADEAPELFA